MCNTCNEIRQEQLSKIYKNNDPWDNLKVGQILLRKNDPKFAEVVEVTERLVALKFADKTDVVWTTKEVIKEYWTIKDSTPKEEDDTCTCPDGCHGQHNAGNGCKLCDSVTAGGGSGCRSAEEKLEQIKRIL